MVITSQYHITQTPYNVAEFFRAISLMLWERTYLTCDSHTIIGKSRPLLLLRFSDNFFSIFVYIFRLNIKAISKIFIQTTMQTGNGFFPGPKSMAKRPSTSRCFPLPFLTRFFFLPLLLLNLFTISDEDESPSSSLIFFSSKKCSSRRF